MHTTLAPPDFSDWSAVLALLRSAFAYMNGRIDPPSSLDRMTADDLRRKAAEERLILAWDGPMLVGCGFAALRADVVYVGKVAVAASARRAGVARGLVAVAEQVARDAQLGWLELQTRVELVENHATFAALGFTKVAETAHAGYTRPTSITMRKAVLPLAGR